MGNVKVYESFGVIETAQVDKFWSGGMVEGRCPEVVCAYQRLRRLSSATGVLQKGRPVMTCEGRLKQGGCEGGSQGSGR